MIRLNSWQESVSKAGDEQHHRLSDLIPPNINVPHDELRRPLKKMHVASQDGMLSNELAKLQNREHVSSIQFWNEFSAFTIGKGISSKCLPVRALSDSTRLTEDLFKISVTDEYGRILTLYVSIRWMLNQGNLPDRSISGIMNGRPLDQGIIAGDVMCLYDQIVSESTVFADKFHLYFINS